MRATRERREPNKTHACVGHEPRLALLGHVWPLRHIRNVLYFALTFVGARNLRHGPLAGRLPELGYLEGTEHDKDDASTLYGTDAACGVCASVAQSIDVVEQRCGGQGAKKEIGLKAEAQNVLVSTCQLGPR
jgi:hypothetical protein